MKLPYYEIDAFTSEVFGGNPAGVCLLEQWLEPQRLQSIAAENNLSETAFLVGGDGTYELRWFTPTIEVDLCGHATLAAAYVVLNDRDRGRDEVVFHTQSGRLLVTRSSGTLALDFPSRPARTCATPPALVDALGATPASVGIARDYLAVFETEDDLLALKPDFDALGRLDVIGTIVTAPGVSCDFVSRFFAPRAGIPEDPVTGSAHCTLVPYWSQRLGRSTLHARQVSARGGELFCEDRGDRCRISGAAVMYLEGSITV